MSTFGEDMDESLTSCFSDSRCGMHLPNIVFFQPVPYIFVFMCWMLTLS